MFRVCRVCLAVWSVRLSVYDDTYRQLGPLSREKGDARTAGEQLLIAVQHDTHTTPLVGYEVLIGHSQHYNNVQQAVTPPPPSTSICYGPTTTVIPDNVHTSTTCSYCTYPQATRL